MATREALYRIAQEALRNALRHGRPRRVALTLADRAGGLVLEVCDDGTGVDPAAASPGHLGMVSIRERAAHIGGRLEVVSARGRGAAVRVHLRTGERPA
jgi:signal transduction histidine kinase